MFPGKDKVLALLQVIHRLGVSSESTPPAAGTLSKKGEIEQNIPELVLSPCRQARRRLALERHVQY